MEAMDKAKDLGISERTANRFLGNFINKYLVMKRVGHGIYEKLPYKESE